MTPALLISRWIGRPSSRRVSPSAATDSREDRSRARKETLAPGTTRLIPVNAASPSAIGAQTLR